MVHLVRQRGHVLIIYKIVIVVQCEVDVCVIMIIIDVIIVDWRWYIWSGKGGGSSLHCQNCHHSVTRPEERLTIATITIFINVIIVINHGD